MQFKEGWLERQCLTASLIVKYKEVVSRIAPEINDLMSKEYIPTDKIKANNLFIDKMIKELREMYDYLSTLYFIAACL
jgi:hypothetical protein